jgi:hypothetical protein
MRIEGAPVRDVRFSVTMTHAENAWCDRDCGTSPLGLRRVHFAASPHLQRIELFVQLGGELRVQRRVLWRGFGELLARLFKPHVLPWFMLGIMQPELHRQFHVRGNPWAQWQRLVRRQLHLPHHLHGVLLGKLHQRHLHPSLRWRLRPTRHQERRELSLMDLGR